MSRTPEKKFVEALREILHSSKSEEDQQAFIKMMEDYCDEKIDSYKD